MVFVGGLIVATDLGAQTLIQNMVVDEYRARVISISVSIAWGGPAFGTLAIGWLAELLGFQLALGAAAITVLMAVALLGRKLLFRSVEMEAEPVSLEFRN